MNKSVDKIKLAIVYFSATGTTKKSLIHLSKEAAGK